MACVRSPNNMKERKRLEHVALRMFAQIGRSCIVTGNFHCHSSTRWPPLSFSLPSPSFSMSQSFTVVFCQCHTDTHTHTHTHICTKRQFNWNNLPWQDMPKMREIKRLAQDQAHSLMQDYRLNTMARTNSLTHTRTQTCVYVLLSIKLSSSQT